MEIHHIDNVWVDYISAYWMHHSFSCNIFLMFNFHLCVNTDDYVEAVDNLLEKIVSTSCSLNKVLSWLVH